MADQNPNDQKSDVNNPNNSAYKENNNNRSRELNPEDVVYKKCRE